MDKGALVGRVMDPGSAVPGRFPDAVRPPDAVGGTPAAGVGCAAGGEGVVSAVAAFRAWLATIDTASLCDRERVELVGELERVKGASSAAQARVTDAVRCSREVVVPQDARRSVGSVVALARRESPTLGDRFVGLARALVHEMPHTMAALTDGGISERVAVAVVAGTAALSKEDRGEVDRRVGPVLGRLGVKQAGRAAARVAAELDAASVVVRMEAAVKSRRVSVRPAPDGMAYLTVLGPLQDVVGAHAAVQARARGVVGGQCPEEAPGGRGVGAVAADTALRLLSGRAIGQPQPVEVHLVMTDRALLGTGDPGRSVFEPARIPGHGSVPAPVARAWLREGLEAASAVDTHTASGGEQLHPPLSCTATGGGEVSSRVTARASARVGGGRVGNASLEPARVWLRRLYTSAEGRDLVAMDSRRRVFGGLLRRMLVLRDDVCTTPWCEAPIVHADHATPVREHGETSFVEGNGKCARCNHGKEAPGWRTRVVLGGAGESGCDGGAGSDRSGGGRTGQWRGDGRLEVGNAGREDASRVRRVVQVTTPLGHRYESEPPPLLGWGSQTFPPATTEHAAPTRPDEPTGAGAPEVRRATAEQAPSVPRQDGSRRSNDPPGWPHHVPRRKRALHRPRTLSGTATTPSRPSRRPRLTSHLERELCRYLT